MLKYGDIEMVAAMLVLQSPMQYAFKLTHGFTLLEWKRLEIEKEDAKLRAKHDEYNRRAKERSKIQREVYAGNRKALKEEILLLKAEGNLRYLQLLPPSAFSKFLVGNSPVHLPDDNKFGLLENHCVLSYVTPDPEVTRWYRDGTYIPSGPIPRTKRIQEKIDYVKAWWKEEQDRLQDLANHPWRKRKY